MLMFRINSKGDVVIKYKMTYNIVLVRDWVVY